MKDRPILFSAPMVRAILAGTKTQTRRIVKGVTAVHRLVGSSPDYGNVAFHFAPAEGGRAVILNCPYGVPGDRLWVRETFVTDGVKTLYRADHEGIGGPWKTSIFMPRKHSRILLEVTDIRVQQVREISADDVSAEGVFIPLWDLSREGPRYPSKVYLDLFFDINKRAPKDSNPWVWVIQFRRIP